MGRTTYQSIGKPLPGRTNIIITKDSNLQIPNCVVVYSIEEAIKVASLKDDKEIFIIGGGQIYKQSIKFADKLYLTLIKESKSADTFFPEYASFNKEIFRQNNIMGNTQYTFLELLKG
jgi:dihydrofolate reductase